MYVVILYVHCYGHIHAHMHIICYRAHIHIFIYMDGHKTVIACNKLCSVSVCTPPPPLGVWGVGWGGGGSSATRPHLLRGVSLHLLGGFFKLFLYMRSSNSKLHKKINTKIDINIDGPIFSCIVPQGKWN